MQAPLGLPEVVEEAYLGFHAVGFLEDVLNSLSDQDGRFHGGTAMCSRWNWRPL